MGPIASRAPAQRHNCVWRVYWGEGGQLNSKTSSCRARLFNFTFPGFPAIRYFQAKIVSSILGGLAPISYLHASSGTSSPPRSGLQCHLLQEAHLSSLRWSRSFLLGAHVALCASSSPALAQSGFCHFPMATL